MKNDPTDKLDMTIDEAIKNREECLKYLEGIGKNASHECVEAVRWSVKALKYLKSSSFPEGRFEIHPSLADENNGRLSMFLDITSALYGKQCYFQQEDGTVYSRLSGTYLSQEEAYREFVEKFGGG